MELTNWIDVPEAMRNLQFTIALGLTVGTAALVCYVKAMENEWR